jgi:septal ring factor EnvC (AmiA/AmiB activator)
MQVRFLSLILIILVTGLPAQTATRDFDEELEYQSQAIQALKKEIAATKKRIAREGRREQTAARTISNLEEQISLIDRLLTEINREINLNQQRIKELEQNISDQEQELEQLRRRYEQRVVYAYKQGSLSPLERVLSSTSWRQAVYRTHYLKLISGIERQTQARINSLLVDIGQQKLNLEASLRRSLALRREQQKQQEELRQKKIAKQRELVKIRKNKAELANLIREKQAGIQELDRVIKKILADKERYEREERLRRQRAALQARSFAELKGKLIWPAEGRVITKFGRQWNPRLKTTTESPGIDIKGKPGSPIRTVMNGIVTTITYIRGYGTTVIIDHGGGFYTVYSHVTDLQTNVNSEVRAGDVIAYMGDSGSVNGAKLHFEIWGKSQKLDPEQWLERH